MVPPILLGRSVTDIFDEVSEDLRADRARQLLQRYGYLLIVAAVLVVAAVGGWKWWQAKQRSEQEAIGSAYLNASREASTPLDAASPARADALDAFSRMAANGPEGYRTLARLRAAALKISAGDLPGALALWDQISADTAADPQLRDLANLLWVQHQVDAGDPAAVQGRLAPLVAPGNPWRPLALECQAWLLLRTGDQDGAKAILRGLVSETAVPDGVRARAGGLLTRLGETPPASAAPREAGG
jgi:hypothetical protein